MVAQSKKDTEVVQDNMVAQNKKNTEVAQGKKSAETAPLVTIKNLQLGFDDGAILKDICLEINRGDFICVVGANGSGKSTLIKGILGLIKPTSGKIVFDDGMSRRKIGYLPQETHFDTIFPATVSEVVLSGCLGQMGYQICYGAAERARMNKIFHLVGIENLKDKSFSSLSGGQKQKVLLSRALVSEPEVLILDEPSNNLDYNSKKSFYHLLKKLNSERGITIIMITHDLDAEDLIGNKIAAIKDGRLELSSTREYLRGVR